MVRYELAVHLHGASSRAVKAYLRGVAPQVRATIVIEQEAWPWQ